MLWWLVLATRAASFGDNVLRLGWDAALKTYWFELALGLAGVAGLVWSLGRLFVAPPVERRRGGSILDGVGWAYGVLGILFLLIGSLGVFLGGLGHWPSWMYVVLGAISLGMTVYEARKTGLWG